MKKIYILFVAMLSALIFISCQKSHNTEFVQINAASELSRLQNVNQKLIKENEDLKSTSINESKFCGKIEYNYTLKNYDLAKSYITVFMDLFPFSDKILLYRSYYDMIEEMQAEEQKTKQLEIEKSMADYTGIWITKNFTDQDGNPINKKFVTTNEMIWGTYSDISSEATPFYAQFIISSKNDISIRLFENGSENPVTGTSRSPIKYNISVTDANGKIYTTSAKNSNDRIAFSSISSNKIHNILMLGGTVNFQLTTKRDSFDVKYNFEIANAQFYNTISRLMGW